MGQAVKYGGPLISITKHLRDSDDYRIYLYPPNWDECALPNRQLLAELYFS